MRDEIVGSRFAGVIICDPPTLLHHALFGVLWTRQTVMNLGVREDIDEKSPIRRRDASGVRDDAVTRTVNRSVFVNHKLPHFAPPCASFPAPEANSDRRDQECDGARESPGGSRARRRVSEVNFPVALRPARCEV